MFNLWHVAYEVSRYTDYAFYQYDQGRDVIWMRNSKKNALMCLHGRNLPEEGQEDEMQYLADVHYRLSQNMDVALIESFHFTETPYTSKHKVNGGKIVLKGIRGAEALVGNPFYRIDLAHKKPKEPAYYQKRLMSRHPFEKFMHQFSPMTYLLICINLIVFLFNLSAIHFTDSYRFTQMLALNHYNVIEGNLYRLLSSSFLHSTVDHFLFNIFALYILGKFTESIFGSWRLLIAYIATGITSSLFSIMFITEGISLGASGAIYGLLAILIVHLLIHGRISAKLLFQIAVVFIVVSVFTQFISNVNHYAHIGGLVFGALLGVLYHPGKLKLRWLAAALVSFILLIILSWFMAYQHHSSQPLDTLAMEHIEAGEYEEALGVLNESIRTNSETAKTYHALGLIAEYAGDMDQARQFHEQSYAMNPNDEWAMRHRLLQLRKERRYDEMDQILSGVNIEKIEDPQLKAMAEAYDADE
ncbi:rhomboid family intramembrane serine protease [Salinicoccus hispanicus]|uniref:Rhomboid family intramembrane serine protease n=1 Tax=Salinicoccus hispanicus TaxID=157225 RepID=A0A6N8U224_9STAP|nr:rhomboid family intramembrane serine protease [Salinicoccus hispanicus]MXQ50191.1 rhomboid family intramembrane serine protease [Salinicoccus hispanicus]